MLLEDKTATIYGGGGVAGMTATRANVTSGLVPS